MARFLGGVNVRLKAAAAKVNTLTACIQCPQERRGSMPPPSPLGAVFFGPGPGPCCHLPLPWPCAVLSRAPATYVFWVFGFKIPWVLGLPVGWWVLWVCVGGCVWWWYS